MRIEQIQKIIFDLERVINIFSRRIIFDFIFQYLVNLSFININFLVDIKYHINM